MIFFFVYYSMFKMNISSFKMEKKIYYFSLYIILQLMDSFEMNFDNIVKYEFGYEMFLKLFLGYVIIYYKY